MAAQLNVGLVNTPVAPFDGEGFDGLPGVGQDTPEGFAFPESFTLTVGFLGSLDEMLIIPLFLPTDVGAKVAVTVHELPFGIVVQLFV